MTPDQLALKEAAKKYVGIQEKANAIQSQRGNCLEYWDAAKQIDDHGNVFRAEATPTAILALLSRIRELEEKLFEAHLDICWNDYHQGIERDGKWQNGAMSDAERLQRESGMGGEWIDAAALKEQLPIIAKSRASAALGGQSQ